MAGAHGDAQLVEQRADVERVRAFHHEAENTRDRSPKSSPFAFQDAQPLNLSQLLGASA